MSVLCRWYSSRKSCNAVISSDGLPVILFNAAATVCKAAAGYQVQTDAEIMGIDFPFTGYVDSPMDTCDLSYACVGIVWYTSTSKAHQFANTGRLKSSLAYIAKNSESNGLCSYTKQSKSRSSCFHNYVSSHLHRAQAKRVR